MNYVLTHQFVRKGVTTKDCQHMGQTYPYTIMQNKKTKQTLIKVTKHKKETIMAIINPFVPNAHFLYPLKTSENRKVFSCFQGEENGCIGNKWVN